MKAIIDGKRYDTETAKKVADWSSPHYRTDFHYYCEALYQTKKSAWFLYGEGNGLSPYSEHYADGYSSGKAIHPLSPSEARSWLESHGFADEIEEYFPDEVEDA